MKSEPDQENLNYFMRWGNAALLHQGGALAGAEHPGTSSN
jgi:hypothetical protein